MRPSSFFGQCRETRHLGTRILRARKRAGMGRYAFARKLGLSYPTLRTIEDRTYIAGPRPLTLRKVARALDSYLEVHE